jgi:hypothetical protein
MEQQCQEGRHLEALAETCGPFGLEWAAAGKKERMRHQVAAYFREAVQEVAAETNQAGAETFLGQAGGLGQAA